MLRLATESDVKRMSTIIEDAKKRMQDTAIPQWQDGYPNEAVLRADIEKKIAYVFENESDVIATAVFDGTPDPNYTLIEKGAWLQDGQYYTIHRIAVDGKTVGKGYARKFFLALLEMARAEGQAKSVRIDTHKINRPMRSLVESLGFIYCGVVYMEDGAPRVAYELIL